MLVCLKSSKNFLKFGAMRFIYEINRLTTRKVDSTYLGWLVNNVQRICPVAGLERITTGSAVSALPYRSGVARGGQGGASAPGRRPEGGAKILTKNFFKFIYWEILKNLKEYNENLVIIF